MVTWRAGTDVRETSAATATTRVVTRQSRPCIRHMPAHIQTWPHVSSYTSIWIIPQEWSSRYIQTVDNMHQHKCLLCMVQVVSHCHIKPHLTRIQLSMSIVHLPPQLEQASMQLVVVQQIKLRMLQIVHTEGRSAMSFPPKEITSTSSGVMLFFMKTSWGRSFPRARDPMVDSSMAQFNTAMLLFTSLFYHGMSCHVMSSHIRCVCKQWSQYAAGSVTWNEMWYQVK